MSRNRRSTTTRTGRPRRAATTAAAIAVTLGLGLGACSTSGGDDAAEEPEVTTTVAGEPAEETTTTVAEDPLDDPDAPVDDPVEDPDEPVDDPDEPSFPDIDENELDDAQDRVDRITLTLDDLPEGWTAEPNDESTDSVMDECSDLDIVGHTVAKSSSDRFSLIQDAGGLTLETGTGYLDDESVAVEMMAELSSDEFAACASEGLVDAEGVEVEGELMPSSGMPDLGDEATALTGDLVLTEPASGQTVHASILVIAVRTDQVVTVVTAAAIDTPGDEQLLYGLLDVIAERQEG